MCCLHRRHRHLRPVRAEQQRPAADVAFETCQDFFVVSSPISATQRMIPEGEKEREGQRVAHKFKDNKQRVDVALKTPCTCTYGSHKGQSVQRIVFLRSRRPKTSRYLFCSNSSYFQKENTWQFFEKRFLQAVLS